MPDGSLLGVWLEEVRIRRQQPVWKAAMEIGITEPTYRRLLGMPRGHRVQRRVVRDIASYLDVTPEIVRYLREMPAPKSFNTNAKPRQGDLSRARKRDARTYPIRTLNGTKYHPTIVVLTGCDRCPFLEPCSRDVKERQGFAWCEDLIQADFDPKHRTMTRESMRTKEEHD